MPTGIYKRNPCSDETKEKISKALKGKHIWKDRLHPRGMLGKHESEEHKRKISESVKRAVLENRHNGAFKKHHSAWNSGKILRKRPEHSKYMKQLFKEGKLPNCFKKGEKPYKISPRLGIKHTEETKRKISEARAKQIMSEEQKIKQSKTMKMLYRTGQLIPTRGMLGRKQSDYQKQRCRETQWRGGLSFEPYTPEFNRCLKFKIRERDNFTCQLCGNKENGRKLSIHHIDYDKKNCSEYNLISLCINCHVKTNINRYYWELYFVNKTR